MKNSLIITMTDNVRMCRHNDNASGDEGAHYWLKDTGEHFEMEDEKEFVPRPYVQEELCPKHITK